MPVFRSRTTVAFRRPIAPPATPSPFDKMTLMQLALPTELGSFRARRVLLLVLFWLSALQSLPSIAIGQSSGDLSDNEVVNSIRKLFSDRCFTCHGPDSETRATELRLDQDDGVQFETASGKKFAVASDLSESEIWNRIHSTDPDVVMPPPSSKIELSQQQKDLVRTWIQRGAVYKAKHWSFEPLPSSVKLPPLESVSLLTIANDKNAIDAFVSEKLKAQQLNLLPEADRGTLARRASLALTGCLPSIDLLQSFVLNPSPAAYERFVDELIASPQFGERVATNWLDLARYADTHGYQTDRYRDVWAYRDWVISAINQDLSFDQFITWQLAGDMLPNPTREQRLATAFNRLHRQNEEGGSTEEEFRVEYMTDRVNTLGTAVMGLTMQCSRCHDHKYDPLKQLEYFQLCDMFDNIDESGLTSYWTDSMPGPTMLLLDSTESQQVVALEQAMQSIRKVYAEEVSQLSKGSKVEDWFSSLAGWPQPEERWLKADFPMEAAAATSVESSTPAITSSLTTLENTIAKDQPGSSEAGAIEIVQDGSHSAVALDGDNALVFPKSGVFSRTQEFTICLDLKIPKAFDRAVVLHRSKSWTDAGSRGYQLLIEDGHFTFGVIHYWPSSAIKIRTKQPVPLNQWMHVALVYGGTNSASDTHIYIDGKLAEIEIVQDSLHKDILYERVDVALSIGARNRDRGVPGGLVDHLQVYDVALTGVEISSLATDSALLTWGELSEQERSQWTEHFARRVDQNCKYHLESLHHYFESLAKVVQEKRELMVMDEKATNHPTRFLNRGAYDTPGDVVSPGVHKALLSEGESMPTNRLELAKWLTSDHHPLTARVAVNHMWQQMFGRGLVVTAEDFGIQGQSPSHPELLDYLAVEFIRSGWSRKAIMRKIALSQVFRQSSRFDAERRSADPDGSLLSHFPAQRLSAEQVRDGALQAGNLLSENLGGPPAYPYQPSGLWEEKSGLKYPQSKGEGLFRRSLYTVWKRTSPPPSMMLFDSAGREVCSARREITVTSLQALVMMNDPQMVEASRGLALRALGIERKEDVSESKFVQENIQRAIENAYLRLTSHECPAELKDRLLKGVQDQTAFFESQPNSAAKLLGVGEWQAIEIQEANQQAKLAALTLVVNSIMNSDAFAVMR